MQQTAKISTYSFLEDSKLLSKESQLSMSSYYAIQIYENQ